MRSNFHLFYGLCLAAALFQPLHAEKADREKPMIIEADRSSSADLARKIAVFEGRVVITQGTLVVRADKAEVRDIGDGFHAATAWGQANELAFFQEKRDNVDEIIQGRALRIEYDGRTEVAHLMGKAILQRYRGNTLADEITGEQISWNGKSEFFQAQSATSLGTASSGRVRAILSPQPKTASSTTPHSAPIAPPNTASKAQRAPTP